MLLRDKIKRKSKLKIGIVVHRFPPYMGGSELYAYKLAQSLSEDGHRVIVYTTKHPQRQDYPFPVREFSNINPPGSGYFFWPAFISPSVLSEIRGLDVLHAFDISMYATLGARLAATICSVPFVIESLYHPPEAMPHPWLKRFYDKTIGKTFLRNSDAFVLQSECESRVLKQNLGDIASDKLYRIPPGPTTEGVVPATGFRKKYGLEADFVLLYVGRIDTNKGTDHLLEAVKNLVKSNAIPNLRLVMVGQEETWFHWPEGTASVIRELGSKIVFTGRIDDPWLAAAYTESDVVAVPSKYESFGFTIIEALSYGTPVIATRVGIAPEVIKDRFNGYLHDYGDAKMLAECILKLKTLDRKELRQNAADSVKDFGWDRTLRDITDLYYSLVKVPKEELL